MMQHRRTLASVKTMAPSLLTSEDVAAAHGARGGTAVSPADAAAGSPRRSARSDDTAAPLDPAKEPLPQQTAALHAQIQVRSLTP